MERAHARQGGQVKPVICRGGYHSHKPAHNPCTTDDSISSQHAIKKASEELKPRAAHYDSTYNLVEDMHKNKTEYEVGIKWSGFDDENDQAWEPFQQILHDMPGPLEDCLHTSGHRNLRREILDLYF